MVVVGRVRQRRFPIQGLQFISRRGWLALRRLGRAQGGITLVELMVVIGIMSLAVSMVGVGLAQTLGLQRAWREDMTATQQLRHAGSWLGGDMLNAQTSSLEDGESSTSSFAITWTDTAGLTHMVVYMKADGALVRTYDGAPLIMARRVTEVNFVRMGDVVTVTVRALGDKDSIQQASWQFYLRRLGT